MERLLRDSSAKAVYQNKPIEAIVTEDMWKQVNVILDRSRATGKRTKHLFAGLVYCHCDGRMQVPSNSPKYICVRCRHKITTHDLEAIFQSQLRQLQPDGTESAESDPSAMSLAACWQEFTTEEKRDIIESSVSRLTVGTRDIEIEFAVTPISDLSLINGDRLATSEANPATVHETPQLTAVSEPLMSEVAAAKFLGISRMTLLRKRNAGEIKFFRVGFRVLYSKEKHLLPFLADCEKDILQRDAK